MGLAQVTQDQYRVCQNGWGFSGWGFSEVIEVIYKPKIIPNYRV